MPEYPVPLALAAKAKPELTDASCWILLLMNQVWGHRIPPKRSEVKICCDKIREGLPKKRNKLLSLLLLHRKCYLLTIPNYTCHASISQMSFTPDGKLIAVSPMKGVTLIDLASGKSV